MARESMFRRRGDRGGIAIQ